MTTPENLARMLGDDFRLDEWQLRVMDSLLERSRDRQLEDLWRSANPQLPRGGWRADRVVYDEASAWFAAEPTPLELVGRIVAANADQLPATVVRAPEWLRVCPRQYGKSVRRDQK